MKLGRTMQQEVPHHGMAHGMSGRLARGSERRDPVRQQGLRRRPRPRRRNARIAPGEFVSLLGPSGSGKTTLLGILGGFIQPIAGSIWFGEPRHHVTPPHKRDIGIVFQNYALFPHMTVGENVAFPLRARRLPKSTWAGKVADALAMVDLSGYEDRGIAQFSGGQRQRVALARAIVFEPRLILMDEPLSALDKQLRETMQIEMRQLHRRLGATIVYVTHDQREALTMSDRVAILKDGRLVQIDTPERLHDHPVDAFVASFIGEATLLPVTRVGQRRRGARRHACCARSRPIPRPASCCSRCRPRSC